MYQFAASIPAPMAAPIIPKTGPPRQKPAITPVSAPMATLNRAGGIGESGGVDGDDCNVERLKRTNDSNY